MNINEIPAVTSLDAYDDALEAFKHGGSRQECMSRLFSLGLPATEIRFLAEYPGRRLMVRER